MTIPTEQPTDIGDGVYAECDHDGGLILTTHDGYLETNRIYVNRHVLDTLVMLAGQMPDNDIQ